MLRLTVFEISAVKWQKLVSERPKMVHPKPFLTPHLETPEDIASKGQKSRLNDRFTVTQTFTSIGCISAEISVPKHKET